MSDSGTASQASADLSCFTARSCDLIDGPSVSFTPDLAMDRQTFSRNQLCVLLLITGSLSVQMPTSNIPSCRGSAGTSIAERSIIRMSAFSSLARLARLKTLFGDRLSPEKRSRDHCRISSPKSDSAAYARGVHFHSAASSLAPTIRRTNVFVDCV